MAFISVPGCVLAELIYSWQGQTCENTLYFGASGSITPTNMETLAAALATWWGDNYAPAISDDVSLQAVRVTDLSNEEAPSIEYNTSLPIPGENTSPSLPNNCALCVSFRTANRGRTARGRNYIVGLCENQTTNSQVDAGVPDFFTDAYSLLIGAGTFVTGYQWCVVSRYFQGIPRVSGIARPVTGVRVVDMVIDSQRRRLPGRGA
jgi:hypothetical protein